MADPLAGGTQLVLATADPAPDAATEHLIAEEIELGVRDPARLHTLQTTADTAGDLRVGLSVERAAGRRVLGYGAASRAVPLICRAGLDAAVLPAVADASPAQQGRRLPGTDIPIVAPAALAADRPDRVLPELLDEVGAALPEVEASGGSWVPSDAVPRAVATG